MHLYYYIFIRVTSDYVFKFKDGIVLNKKKQS